MKRILILFALLQASLSFGSPSTTELQQKQLDQLIEIEANTSGGGGGGGSNDSVSATGAAVPAKATYSGMNVGGTLTGLPGTVNGLKTDGSAVTQPVSAATLPLPTGAATSAAQTTGNNSLSSIDGKTPALVGGRVPVDGSGVTQPVSAASLPLPTGAATEATLSSLDGKVNNGAGGSASSVRVVIANDQVVPVDVNSLPSDHAYVDSVYFDYANDGPVDNTNWVEIDDELDGDARSMHIFDSCGQTLELGVGAAASETRVFLIAPGGPNAVVEMNIGASERLSVRSLGATCSTGQLVITFLD